jgi:RHS repeat-associated protein
LAGPGRAELASTPGRVAPSLGGAAPRVTEVRRYVPATATDVSATETYAYNALGGFSVYDGVAVDDQRARLDGAGKASAAIPATFQGAPVVMDGGGSVTSFGQVSLQYFNFGRHVKTLTVGGPQATTQTYNYDVLGRLVGAHIGPPSGLRPNHDENYIYSDLSSSISASVITPYNVTVPPENPSIPNTDWSVGYDGVDHPLWVRTLAPRSGNSNTQIIYPELDTLGNVRHLYAVGSASDPTFKRDLGSHGYSAFGKAIAISGGVTGADIPFGWQGKRLIAPNLYDSRARVWSADLGAFLQADEYGFLTHSGTLWSWPGQNPFKYRDPSGRDASEWFLNNTSWIDDAAPALAAAGAESEVPGLAQVGEAALLAIRAIDALSSLEAQRQSAAAIAKATSDEENECKVEGAPPPNLSPEGARRAGAFNEAKRQNGIPTSQQPESTGPNLDRRGDPQPGKQYTFRDPNGKEIIIRDDAEGHYYGDGDPQNRGPHFNDPAGNHYDY